MLLDYDDSFDLPVGGGTFSFTGGSGNNSLVGPSPTVAGTTTVTLVNVAQTIPVPVIVIPGFASSFATPPYTAAWFTNIGLPPSELELDPVENYLRRPGAEPGKHRVRAGTQRSSRRPGTGGCRSHPRMVRSTGC